MKEHICWEYSGGSLIKRKIAGEQARDFEDKALDYRYAVLRRQIRENDAHHMLGFESQNSFLPIPEDHIVICDGELMGFYPFTDERDREPSVENVLRIDDPDAEVSERKIYGFSDDSHYDESYTFRLKRKD